MTILILGCNGQVGKELVAIAEGEQLDFVALGRHELDVTNLQQVQKTFQQTKPKLVINATAYTAVDQAEDEKELAYLVNSNAVEYLAQTCEELNIALLHISTDYVFNGEGIEPYLEDDAVDPLGVYGASKLAGEQQLMQHCSRYIILRTSWVFGRFGNNFVKTMLRLAESRDELNVVADQIGCPTSAHSIARTLLEIARFVLAGRQDWGVYHYCGDEKVSWCDFAKIIFESAGLKVKVNPITTDQFPTKVIRPKYSVLNCGKLLGVFGVLPCDWRSELITMLSDIK